jgi:polyferredoxin
VRKKRRIVQLAFLALTIVGVFILRGNAERWCPFGGIEAAYLYLAQGDLICSLGVSNFYVLAGVLVLALVLRRAFCGYVCPIGTLSEWLRGFGKRCRLRELSVPQRVDQLLSLLKYPALVIIVWATWRAEELVFRAYDPCYALIGRHGEDITFWAYLVGGLIVVASLMLTLPFCRWLCPLAALLTPFARLGLARIRREPSACNPCAACARACPMKIPVDRVATVTAARCTACLECAEACPQHAKGALALSLPGPRRRSFTHAAIIGLVLICTGLPVAAAYAFPLPSFVRTRGEPPQTMATVELRVHGLSCRDRARQLLQMLYRDDDLQIPGYLRVEAWPGQGPARVRIHYDPAQTDAEAIRKAIVSPAFDTSSRSFRTLPFRIAD